MNLNLLRLFPEVWAFIDSVDDALNVDFGDDDE